MKSKIGIRVGDEFTRFMEPKEVKEQTEKILELMEEENIDDEFISAFKLIKKDAEELLKND